MSASPRLLALWVGAAAISSACAREEPPPGANPDRQPPTVRETKPERFAVVPDFDGSVEVRFEEPLSGTSGLERRLVASPAFRYRVDAGFSVIKIRPRDGWRKGVVYYFRLPSGIADLLGNRTDEPIEIIFSTGPPVPDTRVSGTVTQRVGGGAVTDARILFFNVAGDSIPYTAVTERGGEFELNTLPPDDYWAFAFSDLNRDLLLQRLFEPYDSVHLQLEPAGVEALTFRMVEPDTTPPVLARVQAVEDSLLRLEFDDYLDPDQDLGVVIVSVREERTGRSREVAGMRLEPGSARAPGREGRGAARRGRVPAAPGDTTVTPADTAAAPGDTTLAPADTAAAPRDTVVGGEPEVGEEAAQPELAAGPGEAQEEPALPSTVLLVELASVLEEGMYRITVEGILNLRSLAGRADTTFAYPEVKASDEDADVAKPNAAKPNAAEPEPDEPEGEGR
ncbi:MAG: Ig-like domain-containing protein [Gemmatimonadota bacterium]